MCSRDITISLEMSDAVCFQGTHPTLTAKAYNTYLFTQVFVNLCTNKARIRLPLLPQEGEELLQDVTIKGNPSCRACSQISSIAHMAGNPEKKQSPSHLWLIPYVVLKSSLETELGGHTSGYIACRDARESDNITKECSLE